MNRWVLLLVATSFFGLSKAQSPILTHESKAIQREFRPVTGILGAFDEEIKFLLTSVTNQKETFIQQTRFVEGTLNGKPVVVALTGIGKVNAAVTTALMIEHFAPREIVFTGIAGGTNSSLSPGDIVIGMKVAYHDYGTQTPDSLFRRPTRNPFSMKENPLYYECTATLVEKATQASTITKFESFATGGRPRQPKVIKGVIVTGDVFVASGKAVDDLRKRMHADATEMEGAAVAQVCWQQAQPFVVVRSLSDNAGKAASNEVAQFYQLAARNSAQLVITLVSLLGS